MKPSVERLGHFLLPLASVTLVDLLRTLRAGWLLHGVLM